MGLYKLWGLHRVYIGFRDFPILGVPIQIQQGHCNRTGIFRGFSLSFHVILREGSLSEVLSHHKGTEKHVVMQSLPAVGDSSKSTDHSRNGRELTGVRISSLEPSPVEDTVWGLALRFFFFGGGWGPRV